MTQSTVKQFFLPALLVLLYGIHALWPTSYDLPTVGRKIQSALLDAESKFQEIARGKNSNELFSKHIGSEQIEKWRGSGISLYSFSNDSLIIWTDSRILPQAPKDYLEGAQLVQMRGGWYEVFKHSKADSTNVLLGLLPIKSDYPFQNKFLANTFGFNFYVPQNIGISLQKLEGAFPLQNASGQSICWLYQQSEDSSEPANWLLIVANWLLIFLLAYYTHRFCARIAVSTSFSLGFLLLCVIIVVTRGLTLWLNFPEEHYKFHLFSPQLYATSIVVKSLGDLIPNCALLLWVVLFYAQYRPTEDRFTKASNWAKAIIGNAFIFLFTALIMLLFRSLIMDSIISFEVYNILSLTFYSLLGLLCVAVLMIIHFIVSRYIVEGWIKSGLSWSILCATTSVATFLFMAGAIGSLFWHVVIFSAIWCFAFTFILLFVNKGEAHPLRVRNVMLFVSLYSVLAMFLIENLYERKERNQRQFVAEKLVSEQDVLAEYTFDDVAKRIEQDGFIRSFFITPFITKKEITDRVNSLYLGGYFNKYDLKLRAFDAQGRPLKSDDTVSVDYYRSLLRNESRSSAGKALHYISDTAQNYSYLALLSFNYDTTASGFLALELNPKVYNGQNVYPELLLSQNVTSLAESNNYDYAIYHHDKLILQKGDFPYTYYWNKSYRFGIGQFAFIDVPGWEHIIYRFANDKKVIVTVAEEPLFEPVATFSYLFSFFMLCTLLLLGILKLLQPNALHELELLSFRTRINYSMLGMIVISFIVIGFVTISFFRMQYDSFYTDRLFRKEKAIHASLEYFVQSQHSNNGSLNENSLNLEVIRLAQINTIDINVYDRGGNLNVSSQPGIYEKGLLSKKMNPLAFFSLNDAQSAQHTQQESIGALSYVSTYSPIRKNTGETIAYLGIPYFERSKDINDEVSSFLIALMNVYVFLLIVAATLAFFISNSITRPLRIISEKLRILNLNKKNEPIQWKSRDEIGVLISEYNKMISELEQSANRLVKSEREDAQREMAKQIAHEVKNPLTPMKLSLQYLQRAIDSGDPNVPNLAKKVSHTLMEQIENLNNIATAFSSFAQMPKAQNEIINLNDLLQGVCELFNKEENARVLLTTEVDSPLVFADKNQLISVFNNLVKNGIQAVSEDREAMIEVSIKVGNSDEPSFVVSVCDNGIGIPPENYTKVFVPNFTTKNSGTGLGLAITKQAIDGAGGKIWFESTMGEGTKFYVELKQAKTSATSHA